MLLWLIGVPFSEGNTRSNLLGGQASFHSFKDLNVAGPISIFLFDPFVLVAKKELLLKVR